MMRTPGGRLAVLSRKPAGQLAISGGRTIDCDSFLADATAWAERLPDRPYAINLCVDRYLFLIGFIAVVLRGQCNLLLPGRQPGTIHEALRSFPDAWLLHDGAVELPDAIALEISHGSASAAHVGAIPDVPGAQTAAIVFTSGSTGAPQPMRKSWHTLVKGARVNAGYVSGDAAGGGGLVATVPPWHMYGLEWSVLFPLVADWTIYCDEAFFPADIRVALEKLPGPRVLVSTPLHLRALVKSRLRFPRVDTVLCATAPLDSGLARDVEELLSTHVLEIYGCSEAGSLAYRWPVRDAAWRFFREIDAEMSGGRVRVCAAHLAETVQLADTLEFQTDGRFSLRGRDGDMVKIGGRRASLSELNNRLLALEGVDDGIVFYPPSFGLGDSGRLSALVVSVSRSAEDIRQELATVVDNVFMPRPIRLVDGLPRSDAGKLRREDLLKLLHVERGRA